MKLVYKKQQTGIKVGQEVKVGDKVRLLHLGLCEVTFFRPPHKPASEGKICLKAIGAKVESEFYVGVIGAEWIEREDRMQPCGHPESAIVSHGQTHHCSMCEAEAKGAPVNRQWEIVDESVHGGCIMVSTMDGDITLQFDIKLIGNRKVIIECENLSTGQPVGFQMDVTGPVARPVFNLPK